MAVETTTSAPAGTFAASWPTTGSIPASRRRAVYDDSLRSEPVTSAPSARATSASPLMPAPPMPTKCRRRPAHGDALLMPRRPYARVRTARALSLRGFLGLGLHERHG